VVGFWHRGVTANLPDPDVWETGGAWRVGLGGMNDIFIRDFSCVRIGVQQGECNHRQVVRLSRMMKMCKPSSLRGEISGWTEQPAHPLSKGVIVTRAGVARVRRVGPAGLSGCAGRWASHTTGAFVWVLLNQMTHRFEGETHARAYGGSASR
jgi:hypothetical protein